MENNNTPLNGLPDNVDLSDIDMNEVILDLNEAKNGMNQLTDELKVQWQLAKMEGQDKKTAAIHTITAMKQDLEKLEEGAQAGADRARIQAHLGIIEAKQRWEAIKLETLGEWHKSQGNKLSERIQSNIKDEYNVAREALEGLDEGTWKQTLFSAAKKLNKSISETVEHLKDNVNHY